MSGYSACCNWNMSNENPPRSLATCCSGCPPSPTTSCCIVQNYYLYPQTIDPKSQTLESQRDLSECKCQKVPAVLKDPKCLRDDLRTETQQAPKPRALLGFGRQKSS